VGVEISTERLILRDFGDSSRWLESVCRFTSDPIVAKYSTWGPLSLEDTRTWLEEAIAFERTIPRTGYELGIFDRSTDELIGQISLHIRKPAQKEAEIGYTIRPDRQGQGFGSEAGKGILDFAFSDLSCHRVFASTAPANLASQAVLRKLGMTFEGTLRKNVMMRGQWRDTMIFSILEEEYFRASS